jgi:hypothetical protein
VDLIAYLQAGAARACSTADGLAQLLCAGRSARSRQARTSMRLRLEVRMDGMMQWLDGTIARSRLWLYDCLCLCLCLCM